MDAQKMKMCLQRVRFGICEGEEKDSARIQLKNTHTCTLPGIQHKFDKLNMTLIY